MKHGAATATPPSAHDSTTVATIPRRILESVIVFPPWNERTLILEPRSPLLHCVAFCQAQIFRQKQNGRLDSDSWGWPPTCRRTTTVLRSPVVDTVRHPGAMWERDERHPRPRRHARLRPGGRRAG